MGIAALLAAAVTVTVVGTGLIAKHFQASHRQASGTASSKGQAGPSGSGGGLDSLKDPSLIVPVYLTKEKRVDRVPLEEYVRGVIAAEMPIEFELEALKAQALAARTYIIRRLAEKDFSGVPEKDAWVTDTVAHQVFLPEPTLKSRWGPEEYRKNMEKLNRAVKETDGKILTYEGKPINATFFSTSNGYTENSEDYWNVHVPYLRSVPSPWDKSISPEFKKTVRISLADFSSKLRLGAVPASATAVGMKVVELTPGHRIAKLKLAGKTYTGREVREALGLNSSQFQWTVKGNVVEITTFGYGHGVGMSQWGANGMAQAGKTAEEIVRYYYTGISVSSDQPYLLEK